MTNKQLLTIISFLQPKLAKHPLYYTKHNLHYTIPLIDNNIKLEYIGFNCYANDKLQVPSFYPSYSLIHSEVSCMFGLKKLGFKDFSRVSVVNLRFNRDGEIRSSRPCNCCQKFLDFLGVKVESFT